MRPAEPSRTGPVLVIEPAGRWPFPNLKEVWERRELLWQMTWRDLRGRYQQMALGPLWFLLQPIQTMVLFTVLFGWVAKLPSQDRPYPVFIFAALLPWNFFSSVLTGTTVSLVSNRQLLTKIYFPRLLLPLSRLLSTSLDLGMSFAILGALLLFYGITPRLEALFVPVWILLAAVTGLGTGLCFAGITVRYRDFAEFANLLGRTWMYLTPVVYSLQIIPGKWRWIAQINPMTHVVEFCRWSLLNTGFPPDYSMLPYALLVAFGLLGLGLWMFRLAESNIADVG